MDDIAGKIAELLGSPEGLEKIKGLSGLLGQSLPAASPPPVPEPAQEPSAAFPFPADTLQAVMKIAPLLSSLKQDDESTRLCRRCARCSVPNGAKSWTNRPKCSK